jgi:acyl-CoA synthetase (AMP-forming)/AMP-acid ligase II
VVERTRKRFLLIKAPPASGKSRALMFIALDKLTNQGIKRVVAAVPSKKYGEAVGAFIILEEGAKMTAEDVQLFCRGKIARYNSPTRGTRVTRATRATIASTPSHS